MSESDKIKIVKRGKNTFDIYGTPGTSSYENLKEAAKELSNYIDKLEKENEELKEENKKLRDTNEKLYETGKQRAIQEILNENWVNKDKIVKIKKQLENREIRVYPGADGTEFAIGIIDKLLEE